MDFGDKNDKVVMLNKLMNEIERGGRNPKTDPSHSDLMNMVTQNHRRRRWSTVQTHHLALLTVLRP